MPFSVSHTGGHIKKLRRDSENSYFSFVKIQEDLVDDTPTHARRGKKIDGSSTSRIVDITETIERAKDERDECCKTGKDREW